MPETQPGRVIRFGIFQVDPRAGELWKKGFRVKLQDQPLQILLALLEKPGEVVTRDELRAKLWPTDTFVDFDHGLNAAVKRLRDALDDSAESPHVIETLPRRGYRFISTIAADTIQAEQHWSLPKKWFLTLAVGALVVIVLAVLAVDVGGLRSRFLYASSAQPQIRSLAVLPLANLSGDPKQEYFADAMTEELISELSRISSLKVISRTSIMQYKGEKVKTLPQIARELNVDAIMEGSVLRSGDRVRIAAQLIYAPTDQHLWVETYERDLGDVLKLQDEIAEAITQQIRLKLTPEQLVRLHQARAVNPEAFEAYLIAGSIDWTTPQEIKKAQSYYRLAIRKDPSFALAYLGLATSYFNLSSLYWKHNTASSAKRITEEVREIRFDHPGQFRWVSPRDAFEPARQAALKALELDEKNCDAHSRLASISSQYDWDWQTAERELRYAIELCPNDATFRWEHAYYTAWAGRGTEALAEMARTREIDPYWEMFSRYQLLIYYRLRNYKEMIKVSRPYAASIPNSWLGHYFLGIGYEGSGQTVEAIPEYQKAIDLSEGDTDPTACLAHAYAAIPRPAEAKKILHELQSRSEIVYVSPYMIATVYASLLDKDKAFEFLEKAYQERSSDLPYFLQSDLRIDNLRSDSRFQDLLRRMNFPH